MKRRGVGFYDCSIIAEPVQRSTAAAIASAAFALQDKNPVMLVMPSDHVIDDAKIFAEAVSFAAGHLPEGAPVILGIRPDAPRDRYGYIRTRPGENGLSVLESFIEKPPLKIAKRLCATPGVFWNSGIFLCRARTLLELLSVHAPDIFEAAGNAMASAARDGNILRPDSRRYAGIPSLSIDHALMEKIERAAVLPLETGWHDVGCWERILALKLKSFARFPRLSSSYESRRSGSKLPE